MELFENLFVPYLIIAEIQPMWTNINSISIGKSIQLVYSIREWILVKQSRSCEILLWERSIFSRE